MKHFDPVSLRLFIAVCEEQSLTLAAERESIAPSAVSKRIAALEEQVGSPLLERGRRGLQLTEAGKALLPGARDVLQAMSRLQAELSEYAHGVHGNVRVAASPSAIAEFLPEDIAAFLQQYEAVRLALVEKLTPEVVRSVEDGRADIGVCWDAVPMRGLQTIPYRADHLVAVVHREHPLANRRNISFAETLDYEHVAVNRGSIMDLTQERRAGAAAAALRHRVEVTTFDAACRIVAVNLGVAIVPREASRPFIKAFGLRAVPLSDDWAKRQFVVCMVDRASLPVPARLLVDLLAAQWKGGLARGAAEESDPTEAA